MDARTDRHRHRQINRQTKFREGRESEFRVYIYHAYTCIFDFGKEKKNFLPTPRSSLVRVIIHLHLEGLRGKKRRAIQHSTVQEMEKSEIKYTSRARDAGDIGDARMRGREG